MIYEQSRFLRRYYLRIAAAVFVLAFAATLGSSLLLIAVVLADKKGIERGRELVRQNCYGCHSFKLNNPDPEAPKYVWEVDISKVGDKTIRYRLEHPVSGLGAIKDKEEQNDIIKYLRSAERKGRHN